MVETKVPMDLSKYKVKLMGPFTTRQVVCGGLAAVIDILLYFLVIRGGSMGINAIIYVLILIDVPILVFCIEIHGMPMEKYIYYILLRSFLAPTKRKAVSMAVVLEEKKWTDKGKKKKEKREKEAARKNPIYTAYK